MMQVSFGVSVFLTMVVAPTWIEYIGAYNSQKWIGGGGFGINRTIQERVYQNRLELRRKIDSEEEK